MKKLGLVIGAFIIAILFMLIGVSIGLHLEDKPERNVGDESVYQDDSEKKASVVGIYHCQSWNGREATLVLNEDGTCEYPGSNTVNAHWSQKDEKKVLIELDGREHEASIVNNGLILYEILFEKLD